MEITAKMVKDLREATGAGPLDCKKALEATGDFNKAIEFLKEKGLAKAAKKLGAGRSMNEGIIQTYAHHNGRLGVIVEVNCETDFVAKTEQFKKFVYDIAIHIANSIDVQYIRREEIPESVVLAERELQKRRAIEEGKPEAVAEKMVDGRVNKYFQEIVLMEQAFVKDESKTIAQLLQETVAEVGESIEIRRFARYALGEGGAGGAE